MFCDQSKARHRLPALVKKATERDKATVTASLDSLFDPSGASAIVAAVRWLEGTLLGTIATTIAVIAIASLGLMMLAGRIELRRGAIMVCGCFILFGATGIVQGLRAAAAGQSSTPLAAIDPSPPIIVPVVERNYDPYAGASLRRP